MRPTACGATSVPTAAAARPGDVVKAFAAGADFVMLGGMLAGHDECEGEWVEEDGQRIGMKFYGMSSRTALDKYAGGQERLPSQRRQRGVGSLQGAGVGDDPGDYRRHPQRLRYVGAARLKDLSKCTTFVLCHRG